MHTKDITMTRYRVRSEHEGMGLPVGRRVVYEVVDMATSATAGRVVTRFSAWGEADLCARYLNDPSAAEWGGRVPSRISYAVTDAGMAS